MSAGAEGFYADLFYWGARWHGGPAYSGELKLKFVEGTWFATYAAAGLARAGSSPNITGAIEELRDQLRTEALRVEQEDHPSGVSLEG